MLLTILLTNCLIFLIFSVSLYFIIKNYLLEQIIKKLFGIEENIQENIHYSKKPCSYNVDTRNTEYGPFIDTDMIADKYFSDFVDGKPMVFSYNENPDFKEVVIGPPIRCGLD